MDKSGLKIWETSKEQISSQQRPENPYFGRAYDFMKLWLGDTTDFELQTSGSTGVPKTINVTRVQLSSSARLTGQALGLGAGTKALVCLNIAYVAGMMMLVRGMELGWNLSIMEPVSNPFIHLEGNKHFDFTALVPMQLSACMEDELAKENIPRLGKILLGGAPVGLALLKQIQDLQTPVYHSYGMTETVSHIALKTLNGKDQNDFYLFLSEVVGGVDDRNCLFISGPMTNGVIVQTNDLVEMNPTGTGFKWIGRADNVINSGGVKIVLDTVDDQIAHVLFRLKLSNNYFTWYQEDEKLGQKLVLFVEGNAEIISDKTLLAEIRKEVSTYQTPKHVYFVNRFEKTPTDKTDKRRTAEILFTNFNG